MPDFTASEARALLRAFCDAAPFPNALDRALARLRATDARDAALFLIHEVPSRECAATLLLAVVRIAEEPRS